LRAKVGIDEASQRNDIGPQIRFFVFGERPDNRQLTKVTGERPVPFDLPSRSRNGLVQWTYQYLLSRSPSEKETQVAREFLTTPGESKIPADGLEDLLWSVLLSPEFQFIQ
jgi:hypothetical protein